MIKWSYKLLRGDYDEAELNGLGSKGWELCAINYDEIEDEDIYIFKKMIEEAVTV